MILIEAPSNLGLKEPKPGKEPGVKFFPSAMERACFPALAGIKQKVQVTPPAYSMQVDEESKVRNADKIVGYSKQLANVIGDQIQQKNIAVVLGGDCSVLIAAALSLKRNGNHALFFLDGHTDYVLPHQSGSSGAAGMDLAIVTGNGHDKLTNIENLKPYIEEKNVYCVANRDVGVDWYVKAIVESNVNYYDLYTLRSNGFLGIVDSFLNMISLKKLDGFWIHFDVDVLNNDIMPCVDSPQDDGLNYYELKQILEPLVRSQLFRGIDVTIFDPTLDRDGIYGRQFAKEFAALLKNV